MIDAHIFIHNSIYIHMYVCVYIYLYIFAVDRAQVIGGHLTAFAGITTFGTIL